MRTGKSIMERPVQFLCPVELSCDDAQEPSNLTCLPQEETHAAIAASVRIGEVAGQESDDIEH